MLDVLVRLLTESGFAGLAADVDEEVARALAPFWAELEEDPATLPALVLRTLDDAAGDAARALVAEAAAWAGRPWLAPVGRPTSSLRGVLLHDVQVGSSAVRRVAALDDRRAVVACGDGAVAILALATGEVLARRAGHEGAVNDVARVGSRLVSVGDDRAARIWDAETLESLLSVPCHDDAVTRVAPVGVGRALTAARDGTLALIDVGSGDILARLRGHTAAVCALAVSPDGSRAASAALNGQLAIWDLDRPAVARWLVGEGRDDVLRVSRTWLNPWRDEANAACWAGDRLITAGREIRARETHGFDEVARLPPEAEEITDAVVLDGALLVTVTGLVLRVRDLRDGALRAAILAHGAGRITSVAVTPDGATLLTADDRGRLRIWSTEQIVRRGVSAGHLSSVPHLEVSADGRLALSAGHDGVAIAWDLDTGAPLGRREHPDPFVTLGGFTPDGAVAITAAAGRVLRWDPLTGDVASDVAGPASWQLNALAPVGDVIVASAHGCRLRRLDASGGAPVPFGAPTGFNTHLVPSEDGALLLTSSHFDRKSVAEGDADGDASWLAAGKRDRSPGKFSPVQLWEVASGRLLHAYALEPEPGATSPEIASAVRFGRDGSRVYAVSRRGWLYGWARDSERRLFRIRAEDGESPILFWCGDALVTASRRATAIHFWTADGAPAGEIPVPSGPLVWYAHTPDGRWLAAQRGLDGVLLFDLRARARIASVTCGAPVSELAITPAGDRIVVGRADGEVEVHRFVGAGTPRPAGGSTR